MCHGAGNRHQQEQRNGVEERAQSQTGHRIETGEAAWRESHAADPQRTEGGREMTVTDYLLIANLVVVTAALVMTIQEWRVVRRKKKEDKFPFPPSED